MPEDNARCDHGERVSVLETEVSNLKEDLREILKTVKCIDDQMTRITRDKGSLGHDDKIDALAIAVAYWVEQMAQNADRGLQAHRQDLLDRELEKFIENAVGRRSDRQSGWIRFT